MFWFVSLSFCKINALLRLLAGQAPKKYTDVYCMSGLSSRLCLCQELPSIVFLDKSSKAAGDHSKGWPNCSCQSHLLHLFDSLMLVKWCQQLPACASIEHTFCVVGSKALTVQAINGYQYISMISKVGWPIWPPSEG